MEKMRMESKDLTEYNVKKLSSLFPDLVKESVNDKGDIEYHIDSDELERLFSGKIDEDLTEHYEFNWPGKAAAKNEAYTSIRKSLKFIENESRNPEATGNVYIKGDNLEALKLLQESYLDKIKLIYIDPPYNTGNDFVYEDDFRLSEEEFKLLSGDVDDAGIRLKRNTDTNGRFHSDWCSMIYSRLLLSRNLLRKDGVIFISIDDYEVDNLIKICDEVFGSQNHVGTVIWERAFSPKNDAKYFSASHDYIVVYAKSISDFKIGKLPRTEEANARYKNPDNDPRGPWTPDNLTVKTYSATYDYPIQTPRGRIVNPANGSCWRVSKQRFDELVQDNRVYFGEDGNNVPRLKRFLSEVQQGMTPITLWKCDDVGHNQEGRQEVKKLFGDKGYFDGPKPQRLMHRILQIANVGKDDIVMDFFAGSSSTAQAVMEYNCEDQGNRKFIMVQVPEPTDPEKEAYKDGYKTICDIGIKRIRLAGDTISKRIDCNDVDIGFRVFEISKPMMLDVFYEPGAIKQSNLDGMVDNITPEYLQDPSSMLFNIITDWGLQLSMSIEKDQIVDHNIFIVDGGTLIACFDNNIEESTISEIAKKKPTYAIFRDNSFSNSSSKINLGEIFKSISPDTVVRVI